MQLKRNIARLISPQMEEGAQKGTYEKKVKKMGQTLFHPAEEKNFFDFISKHLKGRLQYAKKIVKNIDILIRDNS